MHPSFHHVKVAEQIFCLLLIMAAIARLQLEAGQYVIIGCCEEPGQSGKYTFLLYSPSPINLEKLASSSSSSSTSTSKTSTRRTFEGRAKTVSGKKGEEEKEKAALALTQVLLKTQNELVCLNSTFPFHNPLKKFEDLSKKATVLEEDKKEWEREKQLFLLQIEQLKLSKNAALDKFTALDKNDDVWKQPIIIFPDGKHNIQ